MALDRVTINRRQALRLVAGVGGITLVAAAAAPATVAQPTSAQPAAQALGNATIRIVLNAAPPTMDWQTTTSTPTQAIAWNIWETLVTLDSQFTPQPMLADSWSVSSDGLTYTFNLRKGIMFHNGQEMKADDVISSIKRWGLTGAKAAYAMIASMSKTDDYTVVIQLNAPYGSILPALAYWSPGAAIMPASIADNAGIQPVTDYIGTGPYKFVAWRPDIDITLTRFDGYTSRSDPSDYIAGARVPQIKDAVFTWQVDGAARTAAVVAGDSDVALFVPIDQYADLQSRSEVRTRIGQPGTYPVTVFNEKMPISSNPTFRAAVAAGLDASAVLAALGPPQFSRLNASFMPGTRWETDAGKEFYNQNQPDKAKQLLQDSGYNNEPLTYLAMQGNDVHVNTAQVVVQQMNAIGINVNLEILESTTYFAQRMEETGWHLFTTTWAATPDPTVLPFFATANNYPGFYSNATVDSLLNQFENASSFDQQFSIYQQIQQQFWSDMHMLKFGDVYELDVLGASIQGWDGPWIPMLTNLQKP